MLPPPDNTAAIVAVTQAARFGACGLIFRAWLLAEEAHRGQVDKAGHPYFGHPLRVAGRLAMDDDLAVRPWRSTAIAAGFLHDVVEDSHVTIEDLREGTAFPRFPYDVVTAVDLLTRRPDVAPADYYAAIRANPVALAVKAADIADNTDPFRLAYLDMPTQYRLRRKYRAALVALGLA